AGRNPDGATEWDELLDDLATMTGKEDAAAEVVDDYEAEIAAARDRLPGLQGKTFYSGHYLDQEYSLGGGGFYPDLGLEPAEDQPLDFSANPPSISLENVDQLT